MMKRILSVCLVLAVSIVTSAVTAKLRSEIMGIALGMSRDDVRAHLKSLGTLEKEARKRQEVWAIKDARISHVLVGYDPDFRVRYVTAIARTGGPRMRYQEVADIKNAQRVNNQGNYKFTWEVAAQSGQSAYLIIAHGRDPQYLESYSIKKVDQKEID
jgi:hypothetical protein